MNASYGMDHRIVMTLDAGGTNLVFSAIQCNDEIVEPITLPTRADDLKECLAVIVDGFRRVESRLPQKAVAISFAFPGPADYPNGIIGDLKNLPCFRGGVALGPMLETEFGLPVFINNDGDLFAYGEAISGYLPSVNLLLARVGSPKRYRNLLGVTLGTGFGAGIVRDGELWMGDNAAGAEIWVVRNKRYSGMTAEESVSIRGVRREYAAAAGIPFEQAPAPKEIFEIAVSKRPGNAAAAKSTFETFGEVLGDALANVITMVDGLVVIGGGVAGAQSLFMPALLRELNGMLSMADGATVNRTELRAYNLEDSAEYDAFLRGDLHEITVPGTVRKIKYDPLKRIGVGVSELGTSKAVALGAYAFALHTLDTGHGGSSQSRA
jgi:glucokinase